MEMRVIGIDLGKSAFHVVGMDQRGKVVVRKRLSRSQMMVYAAKIPSCLIGMEACCGSHFLAAKLAAQSRVKPFVKSGTNDYLDAEAIAEGGATAKYALCTYQDRRPTGPSGASPRSVINQLRAFLLERGIIFRQGRAYLRKQIPGLLDDAEQCLSPRMRELIERLWLEWKALEEQVDGLSAEIDGIANRDASCRRLMDVPGESPLVATALLAAVGNGVVLRKDAISLHGSCWYRNNTLLAVKLG
jgi:transposase